MFTVKTILNEVWLNMSLSLGPGGVGVASGGDVRVCVYVRRRL